MAPPKPQTFAGVLLMLFSLAFTLLFFSMNLTAGEDDFAEEYDEAPGDAAPAAPPPTREQMLRRPPTPSPTPTTTPIAGPLVMKPLLGDCFQFVGRDGNGDDNRYEVCGYKSVRQTVVKTGNAFACGYWNKWITAEEDGKTKYVAMLYDDGESCNDKVRRQTTVYFTCDEAAVEPQLTAATEPSMCAYELAVRSKLWCDLEKAGLASSTKQAPAAKK